MHPGTFDYLKPTDGQVKTMQTVREGYAALCRLVDTNCPAGADKDHAIRILRESAMWANICITRESDGTPRS